MQSQVTVPVLYNMKKMGEKIVVITAYDYSFARIVDNAGAHVILVGDSLGMVVQGESSTLPVTMDQMIYHTKIVSKAVKYAMVIGDMPFMSYQAGTEQAVTNAGRFLKETGAAAVKLEGGKSASKRIRAISNAGIPVQAHIGLTPQSVHKMGGYKVQRDEKQLIDDALEVESAGAFSVVLEGIPADISKKITDTLTIPTIGIGAGPHCDGQVLVLHDMLGLNQDHVPKFVKKYGNIGKNSSDAIKKYMEEVKTGKFPAEKHCY